MERILNQLRSLLHHPRSLLAAVSASAALIFLAYFIKNKRNAMAKQIQIKKHCIELIRQKKQDIAKGAALILESYKKYPQDLVEELRNADLKKLQTILRDEQRMVTSKDLVIIFGTLCYQEGSKNGWLTDQMFQEALQHAERRDQERKQALQQGRELSLVHGIPFSFKDHIRYKGSSSTWGHPTQIYPLDTQTCSTLQMLLLDGAIPLVKSALPTAPALSTYNVISGFAKNPYNQSRTSGGSSGGQGGFVGSGCTPFGIGSDLAGSIRVPAGWCGVMGLSPSPKRVAWGSSLGLFFQDFKEPEGLIHATLGPLAKSADDIEAIMESLCKSQSFEVNLGQVPLPFSSAKVKHHLEKKHKIGYYLSDGFISPCGAIQKAVLNAKQKLESAGHTLIELKGLNLSVIAKLLSETLGVDQFKGMARSQPEEEIKPKTVKTLISFARMGPLMVRLINWTLRKEPRVNLPAQKSGEQIVELNIRLEEEISKFYSFLQEEDIEALLCPLHSVPAPNPAFFPYGIPVNYTGVFNLLGFASGTVPFGHVTQEDEKEGYHGEGIEDSITKGIRKTMAGSTGLPLAVQVASFNGRDELVVALMKQLEIKKTSPSRVQIHPKI